MTYDTFIKCLNKLQEQLDSARRLPKEEFSGQHPLFGDHFSVGDFSIKYIAPVNQPTCGPKCGCGTKR